MYISNVETRFPNILYIMGTGRSGTTILEILLSNNSDISGVGEVTHIFQDAYISAADCSCGARAPECELWGQVRQMCNWTDSQVEQYSKLFVDFAWHTRFPVVYTNLFSNKKQSKYREVNDCLFKSVADLTGIETVVDSSKYAGRAIQLARMYPENVKIICLTRSPKGLVSAFRRQDSGEQSPKSLLGILLYYIYTMTCFRLVKLALGKRILHVEFEQLSADPVGTLDGIQQWSKVDLSEAKRRVTDNHELSVGHIVTGNRLRMCKNLHFKPSSTREYNGGIAAWSVVMLMTVYKKILLF